MNIDIESLQRLAFDALPVLLDAAVKGLVLLAVAGAVVLAMRKASAAARQMVWLLALTTLIALPIASAALPTWDVLPDWARFELPAEPAAADSADSPSAELAPGEGISNLSAGPLGGEDRSDMHAAPSMAEAPAWSDEPLPPVVARETAPPAETDALAAAASTPGPPASPSWRRWVAPSAVAACLAGVLVCLLPPVLGRISLWRLARRSRRIEGGAWRMLSQRAARAIGLRRPVELLQSSDEPMPMVWGTLRPKLLLPAEADDWTVERRWVVLLHELAHTKRRDCLAKFVAHVACAFYWFNPLCWIAFTLMQRESEVACDDLVLNSIAAPAADSMGVSPTRSSAFQPVRPSDYAQHLLEIASGLKSGMLAAYSSIAMARKSKLEGRLLAILDASRNRRTLTGGGILIAAVLVASLAVPLAVLKATGPETKPSATKADERARKFPAFVVFINNKRYGPTNGSSLVPQEGGVTEETGKSTCGHPGAVSEIEWKYLRTTDAGDEYEVTRRFPIDTATPSTEKKTVVYIGKPLTVFEDDIQRVLFLSRGDLEEVRRNAATQPVAAFGPTLEHRLTLQDADEQGLVFFDMETGKPLKPPFALKLKEPTNPMLVEMTPELRQWIKANGADILLRLEDKGWQLNTLWMQVNFVGQPTQWDSVTPQAAVDIFARKDARGLVRREFPASRAGMDYREFIFSCDAFRTGDDTVGVMQLSATNKPSPVVHIRYRNVLGTGKAATQPASLPGVEPAPGELPREAADLGRTAFAAMGNMNREAILSLAKGDMEWTSLESMLLGIAAKSLRLQDAYVDGNQALLVSKPARVNSRASEPVVVYLKASLTARGWAIASWHAVERGDDVVLGMFVREHPRAKRVYEAPPLTAPPGGRMFPLYVVDENTGEALAQAGAITTVDGEEYTFISDANGVIRVPLRAKRPPNWPFYNPRLTMNVRLRGYLPMLLKMDQDVPDQFTLRLTPGKTIGGTIEDEEGRPIANASIGVWPEFEEPAPPVYALHYCRAFTDQKGQWLVDGVPDKTRDVFVRIEHPDYVIDRRWHDAGPMAGLYDKTNVMVLKKSDITVSGVVVGPDGKPLAGATIRQGKDRLTIQFPTAKTDAAGRYVFHQTPAGRLVLFATAPGCSPQLMEVTAEKGMEPLNFNLSKGNTIRGIVLGSDGKPVEGVLVSVETWHGKQTLNWSQRTDAAGRFEWTEAPSGAVRMKFSGGKDEPGTVREMGPSEQSQTITLDEAPGPGGF